MKVLLAHPGTQYAPHLARELAERGRLFRYWTGLAFSNSGWSGKVFEWLPLSLKGRVANRMISIPSRLLRTMPLSDFRSRSAIASFESESAFFVRNRCFQEAIPTSEIKASGAVIGFDTSSWLLGERARALGRKFILDQSIGHPVSKEATYGELRNRFPEWSNSAREKSYKLLAVELQEHDLADLIVVPSEFVKSTLVEQGVDANKIRLIPFGTDLEMFHPPVSRMGGDDGNPVRFLFVGGLSARKGLPILIEAWKSLNLKDAELLLVGPGVIPPAAHANLPSSIKLLGHKGRNAVANIMRKSDAFVFPSFFEGLAQVQIEAMATGLPVIGTYESGAGGLVEHGRNGLIVTAGNQEELADAIATLAMDHCLRHRMQAQALKQRESLSWGIYGDRWARLLENL